MQASPNMAPEWQRSNVPGRGWGGPVWGQPHTISISQQRGSCESKKLSSGPPSAKAWEGSNNVFTCKVSQPPSVKTTVSFFSSCPSVSIPLRGVVIDYLGICVKEDCIKETFQSQVFGYIHVACWHFLIQPSCCRDSFQKKSYYLKLCQLLWHHDRKM